MPDSKLWYTGKYTSIYMALIGLISTVNPLGECLDVTAGHVYVTASPALTMPRPRTAIYRR